jgi:GntR family transcriptional regulator
VEMRQLGLEPGVELVELGPVTPPPEIAERLGLKAGDKGPCPTSSDVRRGPADAARHLVCPLVLGGGHADGRAGQRPGWHLLPPGRRGSRAGPLRRGGRDPHADPEEARFLRLTDPQPVFNLVRTAFDVSGTPVEVCEHVMSGDRWLLTHEWAAD